VLLLPSDIRDQIVAHAVDSLPAEAVGVLAGTGSQVRKAFALRNLGGQHSFLAHPCDQFQAEMAMRSQGMDILAIYHSHPDGCVCLSDFDRVMAMPWKCAQLIIGVDTRSKEAKLAGYRLSGHLPVEIDVRVQVQLIRRRETNRLSPNKVANEV